MKIDIKSALTSYPTHDIEKDLHIYDGLIKYPSNNLSDYIVKVMVIDFLNERGT